MTGVELQLSIIIVNWRVPDLLRECLLSLYREINLPYSHYEVIVVDNASADNSVEMVRNEFPHVRCVANIENIGFARANNQAYKLSSGRFILLLNPDTLLVENAIGRMLAHIQKRFSVVALGCRLLNSDGTLQRWAGGRFPTLWNVACHYLFVSRLLGHFGFDVSPYLTRDVDHDCEVDWVSGACMLLRRAAIPDPLFDPSYYMYGEDMDLCYRLKQSGGTVVYSPAASIVHYQGCSMDQQEGEILLSSLKGLRSFYARSRGTRLLWLFDAVTVLGFGLRWCAYRMGAATLGNAGLAAKATSARKYLSIALTIFRSDRRIGASVPRPLREPDVASQSPMLHHNQTRLRRQGCKAFRTLQ
jgi:GT2 family glycosyltransferase